MAERLHNNPSDAARREITNHLGAMTELAQNLFALLAEQRRRRGPFLGEILKANRSSDKLQVPRPRMFEIFGQIEMLDLRVIEHFAHAIKRSRGNIARFQNSQPLAAGLFSKSRREGLLQRLVVLPASVSIIEPLVGGDIHALDRLQ